MHARSYLGSLLVGATLILTSPLTSPAGAAELNLYSSRHYDTDERLYQSFTEMTGIEINRIDGDADELIERIKLEGANSPADVLITVDAGRLWRAEQAGLFQPVHSALLNERIPQALRHPDGLWVGFSTRARVILHDKARVDAGLVQRYEDLARPELRGMVCIRSSSNIYNLSLMASMIEHHGLDEASRWAEGVVANFARQPEGNDTAQIKSVAAGQCGVALANTYYFARILNAPSPENEEIAQKVGLIFPNQGDRGAHINISGAGVLAHAPHVSEAVAFLEYLASDQAQTYLANGNNEYAVVEGVSLDNPGLAKMGEFVADSINMSVLGKNQPLAQVAFDEADWR